MKKTTALGASLGATALLISGCAVPVPVQVASWALDGISFLTTEKSLGDHGLSIVAEKDCAIWRGVTEGEVCRQWPGDEPPTLMAQVEGAIAKGGQGAANTQQRAALKPAGYAPSARSDIPPLSTELDDGLPSVEELANFETAAGPADAAPAPASVTRPLAAMQPAGKPVPVAVPVKARTATTAVIPAVAPAVIPAVIPTVIPAKGPVVEAKLTPTLTAALPQPAPARADKDEPAAGVYFVIGSFRNYVNARRLAGRHAGMFPQVLAAKLDGSPVYRVTIGPVPDGREKAVHRVLNRAGMRDTWAIRVSPGDWMIATAMIEDERRAARSVREPTELATVPR